MIIGKFEQAQRLRPLLNWEDRLKSGAVPLL
jgi:hypothetical protein